MVCPSCFVKTRRLVTLIPGLAMSDKRDLTGCFPSSLTPNETIPCLKCPVCGYSEAPDKE